MHFPQEVLLQLVNCCRQVVFRQGDKASIANRIRKECWYIDRPKARFVMTTAWDHLDLPQYSDCSFEARRAFSAFASRMQEQGVNMKKQRWRDCNAIILSVTYNHQTHCYRGDSFLVKVGCQKGFIKSINGEDRLSMEED